MNINGSSFRLQWTHLFLLLSTVIISCSRFGDGLHDGMGWLCVSTDASLARQTRAGLDLPDTCDFILSIRDSKGVSVYEGTLGDCPESLEVPAGSYVVRLVSGVFARPAFDSPQFGDEQCVVVPSGEAVNIRLTCVQMNAGIRLVISPDFLTACPDGALFLKSQSGQLMYSYKEKRFAYFQPGPVSVVLSTGGKDEVLLTRDMQQRDMLTLKVSIAQSSDSKETGVSMTVDTVRVWNEDEIIIGQQTGYQDGEILTVAQAIALKEGEDVWVSGYIVGGDLTSTSASMEQPFSSRTCLLLGPRSSTIDRKSCISVQLPSGEVREALNLVDNPGVFRKKVKVKGDLVNSYYGLVGVKNTSEYYLFN